MNELIPDPARGGDILPWAQGVTNVCRRFGGVGTGRMLVREGPGGIGYEPLPENRRGKTAAVIHGCFEIATYQPSIGSDPYLAIVNRYYRVGHTIGEMSFSAPPEVPWGCDADHPILAIVASADQSSVTVEVERFEDMSKLIERSRDRDSAVIPLYQFKFDDEGEYVGVEIDFRNMPAVTITEDGL